MIAKYLNIVVKLFFMMILILGRFQPLHNGHVQLIKKAASYKTEVVIAIGSASKHGTRDNPFPADVRKKMVECVLDDLGIEAKVVLIPNVKGDAYYVEHVEEMIECKPDTVITENPWTKSVFLKKDYRVVEVPRYDGINATAVREKIDAARG